MPHPTPAQLRQLEQRKITKKALAAKLGISATHLGRITPKLPPSPLRQQREATAKLHQTRKAFRTRLAKQVLRRRRSLESAAREANCSVRTMYRYLCALKST